MRRRLGLLAPALLAVSLLAAPTTAFAATPATTVLAAAAEEPTGPEPSPRTAEDNPARTLGGYEDREVQFTWGAAWILLVAGAVGVTLLAGLYYLLVHRPARETAGR